MTPDLRFRALEADDLEAWSSWWSDPETCLLLGARPRRWSLPAWEDWLVEQAGRVDPFEGGTLGIEEIGGDLVGGVWWGAIDPVDRATTIGLVVGDPSCRRNGVGTQALRWLQGMLFGELGLRRLQAIVWEENQAAIALHRRQGFREEGRFEAWRHLEGQPRHFIIFRLLATEWSATDQIPI